MGELIFVAVLLAVAGTLFFLWRHRTGKLARGIGAAGARYNELNGQGAPPTMFPPAASISDPPDGGQGFNHRDADRSPDRPAD